MPGGYFLNFSMRIIQAIRMHQQAFQILLKLLVIQTHFNAIQVIDGSYYFFNIHLIIIYYIFINTHKIIY
ncbi:MAG: hypothetical protein COW65_13485 [Cytophagales bacterium CG18_big_fil_WC_8_21_14_2_50_42_9]|nr:MAG: hypothetical protein COW65_13485 [Cytophagales bacterium CG18_big_fil_WC_8_21_14_2_50_42_9]